MTYPDNNYLSTKGKALLAKLLASQTKIQFTRAALGSGTVPDGKTPQEMTDLAEYKVDGTISEIGTPVPGEAQTTFQVFSRDVDVGFLASEGAVWAMDPDEGEILFTYIVIAGSPEWIRASGEAVQKFAEFTCINIIGAVEADVTVVNPEAIATMAYVKRRLDAFLELSDSETPAEDTRLHLFATATIEDWYGKGE